jgi:hypothetical protein
MKTPHEALGQTAGMHTAMNSVKAFALVALGLAVGAMGFYVAEADDAPGAAGMGLLLMVAGVVLGVKAGRNRLPRWAARTALAIGVAVAAFAALLTHGVVVAAPLFGQAQAVPSVAAASTPQPQATVVARARELVRAAVVDQNRPGVSVAVGAALPAGAPATDGAPLLWAEGFGWRDVVTRTPVTPATRFNIGTAASAVAPAAARLGLTHTGADAAKEWSPEAIGEEGEDFPPLTLLRHLFWQPLGLMPMEYPLPGERATFYVPRSDDNPRRGRRLMYMRDLACCADGMAFSSTPSDLVRVALAINPGHLDGVLAGGTVMSIATRRDGTLAVAVTSNIAHADTASIARRIGDVFAEGTR